jgi:hypothetical protein
LLRECVTRDSWPLSSIVDIAVVISLLMVMAAKDLFVPATAAEAIRRDRFQEPDNEMTE